MQRDDETLQSSEIPSSYKSGTELHLDESAKAAGSDGESSARRIAAQRQATSIKRSREAKQMNMH